MIEKCDSLWQGNEAEKKYHESASVCKPKRKGGLGLRQMKQTKQALIDKWLWRLGEESEGLWKLSMEYRHSHGTTSIKGRIGRLES